jgi:hypothetical protein
VVSTHITISYEPRVFFFFFFFGICVMCSSGREAAMNDK